MQGWTQWQRELMTLFEESRSRSRMSIARALNATSKVPLLDALNAADSADARALVAS